MEIRNDESRDLASFGYKQELDRSLGSFSSFAAGFSYISILTGVFQMFYLGYGAGGPAFVWSWPMVFLGHLMIALCFAELAAHYPLSGGVYQWSKYVGGPFVGWMTGWTYLACLVVTLAAVALAMQNSLPQIWDGFQLVGPADDPGRRALNGVILGCGLLVISTGINSVGVRLLSAINNAGVFSELVGVGILVALLAAAKRSPAAALLDTQGKGTGFGYLGAFLLAAALTPSYVMYGYDTAGSLAEETRDPRRKAPRAILQALSAAAVAGLLLLLTSILAAKALNAPELSSPDGGLALIVKDALGPRVGRILLCDVVFAIFVCALTVHTGAIRLIFAMARDGVLPFSRTFARVSETSHVPVIPALFAGAGGVCILLINVGFPKIVELVTAVAILWANIAYLLVVASLLFMRLKGWPGGDELAEGRRAFSLGRFGLPVNALALAWSVFMVFNVGWPRAEVYGEGTRFSAVLYTAILFALGGAAYAFRRAKRGAPAAAVAS
ncbi:MAG: amino acid permease [Elusimicrobia bacterium]|nr:amino acid permease [Elusimicrobiota bacterium]